MITQSQLQISRDNVSPNYDYCKIAYAGNLFDSVALRGVNVCVLPFETDDSGKNILALYLTKYYHFLKESHRTSTLLYKNKESEDESNLDTVMRCINDTMKIALTDKDISRVFYLGELELNHLISGAVPCYGVNVTGLTTGGQYVISDELDITLNKIMYTMVLRGTSQDYLVAASVFMLLSYLA